MNKGALIGMVLGDGYIKCYKHTAALSLGHSIKQKEYALFKAKLINLPFSQHICKNNSFGRIITQIRILTKSHNNIFEIYKQLYIDKQKTITKELLDQLNPLDIALWYFDDGCYSNGAIRLSTNCFSYQEHILVQNYFKSLGISSDIRRSKRKYYDTYFNKKNALLFLQYILPECSGFPDSIKYKLGPLWDGNKQRLEEAQTSKLNSSRKYNQNNKLKGENYRIKNRDKISQKKKEYGAKNKEKILAKAREYNLQNKEKISKKNKKYYQFNKQHIIQKNKLWAGDNQEKVKSYKEKYRKYHPDRLLESQRKHRLKIKVLK